MNERKKTKTTPEKKTVHYGRSLPIICLLSGTGLIVLTPFLLSATNSQLRRDGLGEASVAPILMTLCVFTLIASMILIIGAIVTCLLLPSKISYESNFSEPDDDKAPD